jgi:hypothetical protein
MKAESIFPDEHFVLFRIAGCVNHYFGVRRAVSVRDVTDTCGAEFFSIGHATPERGANI